MADLLKLLCLSFFLAILVNGTESAYCTVKELKVTQVPTGKKIAGKKEFNVTVTNTCICTATDVNLSCEGFKSVTTLDGGVLLKSGNACRLNNGSPIYGSESFSFKYVWDHPFALKPLSVAFACS